ncbi:MAG TPA: 1-acyl-sn-glycerol-3-phosphate acyltransferase [Burkholderiales bacterium]
MRLSSPLLRWWQDFFSAAGVALYFNRLTVLGRERLPRSGPVLYLGLHRNGAVDGFVYHRVVPRAEFMIARQLLRSPLGRLFFRGIEVVRDKDGTSPGERAGNRAALQVCLAHLRSGGELAVLPEGTSDLGPSHLPFKRGAARLAQAFLAEGAALRIVPLGIHYERAWEFRSNVEVVVGEPIATDLPAGASEEERTELLHERFTRALEAVGVNVASAEEQARLESLAYAATLGADRSYFSALKAFERGVPPGLAQAWQRLERDCDRLGLARHQGVPLVPLGRAWLYVVAAPPLALLAAAALLLNAPPALLAVAAARRMADARNVVALWRLIVGVPALIAWALLLAALSLAWGAPALFLAYVAVSIAGIAVFYRAKKLAVTVYNLLRGRALRSDLLTLKQGIDAALAHAP